MRQFLRVFTQDTNEAALHSEEGAPGPVLAFPIDVWPRGKLDAIQVDSCALFERIAVKTRQSLYELIVLSGRAGEVLVRGGRFFPEFRRATLVGSTAGGSAVRLRSIEIGLRMELHADGTAYTTSPVQTLSRE